jgi:disulfide bond formation protein DsbB
MAALLDTSIANCAPLALTLALLLALAATILVLFVGEVLGDMPCALCWYQLIAIFRVVILGVAATY